jgi:4'-phosphopantetheinyl transferase
MHETKPAPGSAMNPACAAAAAASLTDAVASHARYPADPPAMLVDEIHVWVASLEGLSAALPSLSESLSAAENGRAHRFQFDRDRDRFIVRRGLLRTILARYVNIDPAQIPLTSGPRGKPALAGPVGGNPVHFNVSHSDGLALFAIACKSSIGVDVERVRPIPDTDRIAAQFFSARENDELASVPAGRKLEAFFSGWTRKEAYLKATGEGIAYALPQIEVSLAPGQEARLLSIAGDTHMASLWSVHSLAPAPGFVGALAVKARGLKVVCRQWPRETSGC